MLRLQPRWPATSRPSRSSNAQASLSPHNTTLKWVEKFQNLFTIHSTHSRDSFMTFNPFTPSHPGPFHLDYTRMNICCSLFGVLCLFRKKNMSSHELFWYSSQTPYSSCSEIEFIVLSRIPFREYCQRFLILGDVSVHKRIELCVRFRKLSHENSGFKCVWFLLEQCSQQNQTLCSLHSCPCSIFSFKSPINK